MPRQNAPQSTKSIGLILLLGIFMAVLCVSSVSAVWITELNNGLISWYAFNESAGAILTDIALGTHNGTSINTPTLGATGIIEKAYSFAAASQEYIELNENTNDFNFTRGGLIGHGNITISAWVYDVGGAAVHPIVDRSGGGQSSWEWKLTADKRIAVNLYETDSGTPNVATQTPIPINTWVHVVMTTNGTHLSIYINGTYNKSTTYDGTIQQGYTSPTIGAQMQDPTITFNGRIDEVGIWNRSLSNAEILSLYNEGNASNPLSGGTGVQLIEPADASSVLSLPIVFHGIISTGNVLKNATLFVWNSTTNVFNQTEKTISGTLNDTYFNISVFVPGDYHWNIYGCSENHICAIGISNYSFTYGISNINQTYVVNVSEMQTTVFNVTFNISVSPAANLWWNGTKYPGTMINLGGQNWRASKTLVIPEGPGTKNLFWEIFYGGFDYNTTTQAQTVSIANFSKCGVGAIAVNYSIYDETYGTSLISNFAANFIWSMNESFSPSKNYSLNLSGGSSYSFCVNFNQTIFTNVNIELSALGYNDKIYSFVNKQFSNTTTYQKLFLLNNTLGRDIVIEVSDIGLSKLKGYTVEIYKTIISSGEEILVGSGVTDIYGQVTGKFIEHDGKYKIKIYNTNGALVLSTGEILMACRSAYCVYPIVVEDTSNPFTRFGKSADPTCGTGITGVSCSLNFNNNTNIFTFTWSDSTSDSAAYNLTIQRFLFNGTTIVCSNSSTVSSGTMTCSAGNLKASYTAQVYRIVSGVKTRIHILNNIKIGDVSLTYGLEGLFWSFILLFTFIIIGIYSPAIGMIIYLGGFILLGIAGIMYINPAIVIAELVIGILFIWSWKG